MKIIATIRTNEGKEIELEVSEEKLRALIAYQYGREYGMDKVAGPESVLKMEIHVESGGGGGLRKSEPAEWAGIDCPKCKGGGMVARDNFGYFCVVSGCDWHAKVSEVKWG